MIFKILMNMLKYLGLGLLIIIPLCFVINYLMENFGYFIISIIFLTIIILLGKMIYMFIKFIKNG
jgi:hypothetical protein